MWLESKNKIKNFRFSIMQDDFSKKNHWNNAFFLQFAGRENSFTKKIISFTKK